MTLDELFQRATSAFQRGDLKLAETLLRQILASDPNHVEALSKLGFLLAQAGQRAEALPFWRRAAAICLDGAPHRYNLAELLRQLGQIDEAEGEFRAAIALAPNWADAHFGLANTLKAAGRTAEALASYDVAVRLLPGFVRALYNRANLLREEGRVAEAERDYRRALDGDPGMTDALVNLAVALGELHRWAEAEDCYRRARARRPNDPDLSASLAGALLAQGRTAEAADLMAACETGTVNPLAARLQRETLLPPVAESAAATSAGRERLTRVLDQARQNPPQLDLTGLHQKSLQPPMALAYHAEDPRPLLEAYAALYASQIREINLGPPADGKPRIGVVVTHGHEGVYDRCLGRLVERIASAGRVHVTLVCSQAGRNTLRHLRAGFPGDCLIIPNRIDEAAAHIADARFHLLHYWEIGTDATNYFLPFFRPTRVQCATWGWPVTSGNSRVDWYVSATPLEPADGEGHYTERLVRLRSLPTCYERPPAPPAPPGPAARRRAFGVDAGTPVYLCVQNVRKVHPDFDAVLADLLARDARGRVVLVADEQANITESLLARLRRTLGPDIRRVGTIGRQDRSQYLRLVSSADVLLDTLHYGSGANTVADATACGTPLVTIPGRFHRGRWAAAVLRQAGLDELVAGSPKEYVETAIRVATDESERRRVSGQTQEFGKEWFDVPQPAVELEAFWMEKISR